VLDTDDGLTLDGLKTRVRGFYTRWIAKKGVGRADQAVTAKPFRGRCNSCSRGIRWLASVTPPTSRLVVGYHTIMELLPCACWLAA
jgi:hypothetical protein